MWRNNWLTRMYAKMRFRIAEVRWGAEDGLQTAEALMLAMVGVIIVAAVGVAFREAIPRLVNAIIDRITSGI